MVKLTVMLYWKRRHVICPDYASNLIIILTFSSPGKIIVPMVVCLAVSVYWIVGLMFHYDLILTY